MKKIVVILSLFLSFAVNAQTEGSAFTLSGRGVSTPFATDYQSLGINPANLGFGINNGEKRIAIGASEFGISTSSKLFNNDVIKNVKAFPLNFDISSSYTYDEFAEVSADLQDGFNLNADFRYLGAALTIDGIGTFAFSLNDKYQMDFGLSKDFADIATYGFGAPYFDSLLIDNGAIFKVANTPNNYDSLQADTNTQILAGTSSNPKSIADIIQGTRMNISWLREWNVGFGRHIFKTEEGLSLYAGGSLKYIQGLAVFDVGVNNNQIDAFAAYSPSFNKNSGAGTNSFLGAGAYRFSFPKASGSGFGIDLGSVITYKDVVRVGVAVNDIGSVTWKNNTYRALTDSLLTSYKVGGFYDDSTVSASGGSATFDSVTNALLKIESTNVSRKIALASTMRLGIGFVIKKLEIGADIVMPFNEKPGSLDKAIIAIGGGLRLGPIVVSSGAVFGGNYLTRVPLGFVFSPASGTYEMGISTRDILSLISFNSVEKPILSGSFGFARFKF